MFAPPNTCIHVAITSAQVISVPTLVKIGNQAMLNMAQPTLRVTAYELNENNLPTISIVFPANSPNIQQTENVVEACLHQADISFTKVVAWDHPLPKN